MRKLLVSDFDRTLYVNSEISPENLAALEGWKQAGNIFAIATGREERILRELLCQYQLAAEYLICNNGARVVDWGGKTLFEETIEDDTARCIVKELWQEYQIPVDVTQKNGRFQVDSGGHGACAIYNGICVFKTLKEFEQSLSEVLQIHVRFQDKEQTAEAADAEVKKELLISAGMWRSVFVWLVNEGWMLRFSKNFIDFLKIKLYTKLG